MGGRRVAAVGAEVVDVANRPTGKKVVVRSKVAAISGGALNSPALLLRSGLDGHGRVGKRTFLHPVVVMVAEFEEPVEAFSAAPPPVHSHHFIAPAPATIPYSLHSPPIPPLLPPTPSPT